MSGIEQLVAQLSKQFEQQETQFEQQAKILEILTGAQAGGDEASAEEGPPAGGGGATAVAAAAAARAAINALPRPVKKSDAEIRSEKISQLHQLLRKFYKLKDYKTTSNEHIKEWLVDFEEEISNIAKLSCNLDLSASPLTRVDYVAILRDKLAS